MYGRLKRYLEQRYPGELPFHLLHGQAGLLKEFKAALQDGRWIGLKPDAVADEGAQGKIVAREWFLSHKRSLLAPFGAGTVDQALLSVLKIRHMFVRLFALAHKVVIIDEVHAYDAYMSTLLERLLAWLRSLGCTVILLSATLPAGKRRDLLRAWGADPEADPSTAYPRVSLVCQNRLASEAVKVVEARRCLFQEVSLEIPAVLDFLAQRLTLGGCAAWIMNTVKGAQDAFRSLERDPRFAREEGWELQLFHARFPVGDRASLEAEVLARFGKPKDGKDRRPQRAVLVATQVVEQSLDLDFDLMVSELAPVDLLLQRSGRLQRHRFRDAARPGGLKDPILAWGVSGGDGDGFGASGRVYPPYLLHRTRQVLRVHGGELNVPGDIHGLVEQVYGDPDSGGAEGLRQAMMDGMDADKLLARRYVLPKPDGEDGLFSTDWVTPSDDEQTAQKLTRLAEPSARVVCLHRVDGRLCLDPQGRDPMDESKAVHDRDLDALAERMIQLPWGRVWSRYRSDPPRPAAWETAPILRHCDLAVFEAGRLVGRDGRTLVLDTVYGLYEEKA
jgi:CRISPR-associated endonuclease/helicase Cas3